MTRTVCSFCPVFLCFLRLQDYRFTPLWLRSPTRATMKSVLSIALRRAFKNKQWRDDFSSQWNRRYLDISRGYWNSVWRPETFEFLIVSCRMFTLPHNWISVRIDPCNIILPSLESATPIIHLWCFLVIVKKLCDSLLKVVTKLTLPSMAILLVRSDPWDRMNSLLLASTVYNADLQWPCMSWCDCT